jgi:hypothetical protein
MIAMRVDVIHSLSLDDTCLKFVNTCVYSASD